jgi:hypothetical protein
MVLCVLLCGMLRSPWGYRIGWVLQAALVASGLVLGAMYFLGAIFAGLWWYALRAGRLIDAEKAAAYAAYEAAQAQETQAAQG